MPLGKSSIKRVQNNGYSQVKSTAPDMENSTVSEPVAPTVEPKGTASRTRTAKKKSTPEKRATEASGKKPTTKKRTAKSGVTGKKAVPVSDKIPTPVEVVEAVSTREGEGYVNIGGQMPIYLL